MKQIICDRCGKVIGPHNILGINGRVMDVATTQCLKRYGLITTNYDLCENCYEELNIFMKGEDLLLTRLKCTYKSSDVVMSEFLRSYKGLLTVSEQRYLLEWSGDDEFMEVLDNGEIVEKRRRYKKI